MTPVSGSSATVRKALRISPELAQAIDQARGDVPWSRWVRRAIEAHLERNTAGRS